MKSRMTIAIALLALNACATLPEGTQRSEQDPWESYNRAMYQFNDSVDRAILRPAAKGYQAITPDPVETGIRNFFNNLGYPIVIINQFLQGKFIDGSKDLGRFLFNSTAGIGGLFDPASLIGLEKHEEDFGQTLVVWGVPQGPYFVLPFLGPSTITATIGMAADYQIDPAYHLTDDESAQYALTALNVVQLRAQFLSLDEQLSSAFDPYSFMREAYLQNREYRIHDGNPPQDEYYDDLYEDFETFDDELPPETADSTETDE